MLKKFKSDSSFSLSLRCFARRLAECGLISAACHYDQIMGRQYVFISTYGSHEVRLMGTIKAVEDTDEGGVRLFVSNPFFSSDRLVSLRWSNMEEGWTAEIEDPNPDFIKQLSANDDDNEEGLDDDEREAKDQEFQRKIDEHVSYRFFPGFLKLI